MEVPLFCSILKHAHDQLLLPTGAIYLYHNLVSPEQVPAALIGVGRVLKPRLKYLLGVDFGRLTTEPQMDKILKKTLPEAAASTEVLLSASHQDTNIAFDDVSNPLHRNSGKIIHSASTIYHKHADKKGGKGKLEMRQNLITIQPAPGLADQIASADSPSGSPSGSPTSQRKPRATRSPARSPARGRGGKSPTKSPARKSRARR